MKKIFLFILASILVGCSSNKSTYTKVTTCDYITENSNFTSTTHIVAYYNNSELLSGELSDVSVYTKKDYAKLAYDIYTSKEDSTHTVEYDEDANTITVSLSYPESSDSTTFIDQIRVITLNGGCTTTSK